MSILIGPEHLLAGAMGVGGAGGVHGGANLSRNCSFSGTKPFAIMKLSWRRSLDQSLKNCRRFTKSARDTRLFPRR